MKRTYYIVLSWTSEDGAANAVARFVQARDGFLALEEVKKEMGIKYQRNIWFQKVISTDDFIEHEENLKQKS